MQWTFITDFFGKKSSGTQLEAVGQPPCQHEGYFPGDLGGALKIIPTSWRTVQMSNEFKFNLRNFPVPSDWRMAVFAGYQSCYAPKMTVLQHLVEGTVGRAPSQKSQEKSESKGIGNKQNIDHTSHLPVFQYRAFNDDSFCMTKMWFWATRLK